MAVAVELREAAAAFCRDGMTCAIERLGEGNINDTFLVHSSAADFVLQKINDRVFPEPRRIIDNFATLVQHLKKNKRKHDVNFLIAEPVPTIGGELCYRDGGGGFWRGQTHLPGAPASRLAEAGQLRRAGRTLARFHHLAADLDVAQLAEPLPGFHHLPGYMSEFDRLLEDTSRQLDEAGRYCLQTINRIRPLATLLEDARQAGILPVQPIHGDPKIDNFLFSDSGDDGMLDFDTVSGGLIHYDLGDCLRSCCNRAGEKGDDPSAVSFDLTCCRSLLEGYFSGGCLLTEMQRKLIFEAVYLIGFELGLRFFTDHLRGNTYFRVANDGENLSRAVRQFRLVADIGAKEQEIRRIIAAEAIRQRA